MRQDSRGRGSSSRSRHRNVRTSGGSGAIAVNHEPSSPSRLGLRRLQRESPAFSSAFHRYRRNAGGWYRRLQLFVRSWPGQSLLPRRLALVGKAEECASNGHHMISRRTCTARHVWKIHVGGRKEPVEAASGCTSRPFHATGRCCRRQVKALFHVDVAD